MKTRVNVVLGLYRLSVPQKIEKARFIVQSMKQAARAFPEPATPLEDVTRKARQLEDSYIVAQGGGPDDTALMYAHEKQLDKMLISLGHYVEDIANDDPETAEAVILSAGMNTKKAPVHTAKEFNVKHGDNEGEVLLRTKYVKGASYVWEYSAMTNEPPVWKQVAITTKGSHELDGLESGKRYAFRVAVITKEGQGPWSNKVELIAL